jgi:hypothetical protein
MDKVSGFAKLAVGGKRYLMELVAFRLAADKKRMDTKTPSAINPAMG